MSQPIAEQLIQACKSFAQQADRLEAKAFADPVYQQKGFIEDFNQLFSQYAYGNQNRCLAGLNFRKPARYHHLASAISVEAKQKNRTNWEVFFYGAKVFQHLKFRVSLKEGEWRLTKVQTCLARKADSDELLWRTHKL